MAGKVEGWYWESKKETWLVNHFPSSHNGQLQECPGPHCHNKTSQLPIGSEWSEWKSLSRVRLFVTPGTKQSIEFSRPEYWMDSLSLLQGIFPTQASNPGLPHCRWILYHLSHKGSPKILEWVPCPFSSRSSWSRNRTEVSCIAGGFFTNWAIREAAYKQWLGNDGEHRWGKG